MFTVNRLAGLGLVLYLFLHLAALSQLARGQEGYDSFLALVHNPLFKIGELLVVAACALHGLNGLRIVLTSASIGIKYQRQLAIAVILLSAVITGIFAIRMFG